MSDLAQALLIGGGIFVVMMATQYGHRDWTWHKWAMPLISVAAFAYFYLKDAPTGGAELLVYLTAAVVGGAFGVVAARYTKVERRADGEPGTVCGAGFAMTWFLATAVRIGFIVAVENIASFNYDFGKFMITHGISFDAIAPFFVIMALFTVVVRLAIVAVRIQRLRASAPLAQQEVALAV